jgi:MFS family permease
MTSAAAERPIERPTLRGLLTGPRARVVWAISLGVALHAVAWFLIATAMPTIVLDLGGVRWLSAATTIFMATSVMGSATAGYLDRHWGRHRLVAVAVGIVILGSALCSLAPGMAVFLCGRGLQGLGDGMVLALAFILIGTALPVPEVTPAWAVLSLVWAAATVVGPVLAGSLTETLGWRIALLPVPVIAVAFLLVGYPLPGSSVERAADAPRRPPLLRLLALGVGIAALSMAGESGSLVQTALLAGAALLAAVLALVADRRARHRLFPRHLLSLRQPAALGIWIIAMMYAGEAAASVFVPYLVQVGHGTSAFAAGQFAALSSIAWSASAFAIRNLASRRTNLWILLGPLLLALGLGVLACWMLVPLALSGIGLIVLGSGFGTSYGFYNERIVGNAEPDDRDLTAGAIPTLESIGASFGAAMAGLLANLIGFGFGSHLVPMALPPLVFGFSAALALLAFLGAVRFARLTRSGTRDRP